MKILFCTSNRIGSSIIRKITWSEWSHCALVDGDYVIEAVYPKVRVSLLKEVIRKYSKYTIANLPCFQETPIINAALTQIGKPYDWTALLGILWKRDWQEEDSWFCSELVAWAFSEGGSPLFRKEAMHRVTPQDLWGISK